MKKIFLIIAIAISGIIYAETPADWAKLSFYADSNAVLTTPPAVVFMGNSITRNWVKKNPDFWASHPEFAARGISGQTTVRMLERFHADVVALHPRAVVILAGINDIAENDGEIPLEDVAANIRTMCRIAKGNGIVPIVCSVLPCDTIAWNKRIKPADKVVALNKLLKQFAADNNLVYVDYYTPRATDKGGLKPEYTKDGCHPEAAGYIEVMNPAILEAIKRAGIDF